ncbi:hypothetical protein [Halorubrum aethiopicum]|uniref:hypothetical protein n=1 Tax=Halorubrum aethiopicum TaxID=1758255 RepID=UPI000830D260|nr:hypothetical protein [Halorubrum aethiopicum]
MNETATRVETRESADRTTAVVEFELPEGVVEEILDERDDLDRDAVSDRIEPVPLVDGERV